MFKKYETHIVIAIAALAVAAVILYRQKGLPISVAPMAAGTGPSASHTNMPPENSAQAFGMSETRPWGTAAPLTPMIRRTSGVMGIPEGGTVAPNGYSGGGCGCAG